MLAIEFVVEPLRQGRSSLAMAVQFVALGGDAVRVTAQLAVEAVGFVGGGVKDFVGLVKVAGGAFSAVALVTPEFHAQQS